MRYDRASAIYADFGTFITGMTGSLAEVLDAHGEDRLTDLSLQEDCETPDEALQTSAPALEIARVQGWI